MFFIFLINMYTFLVVIYRLIKLFTLKIIITHSYEFVQKKRFVIDSICDHSLKLKEFFNC